VIDPELYYQLWKQEHRERIRTAARRQAIGEARLTPVAERSGVLRGSISTLKNWVAVLGDGVLRLRRHWTVS